jgi:hypothetical protein
MIQSRVIVSSSIPDAVWCTRAFLRFHTDIQRLLTFLNYLGDEIGKMDSKAQVLFVGQFPFIFELAYCRSIDNFLTYISELLTVVFENRPEMLKSSDVVTVEEIFSYSTREELLSALIEKKVLSLSFKGMKELNDYLRKTVGFELFLEADLLQHAAVLIEKRNLAIHNRCVVNRRYLERVTGSPLKLGDSIEFPNTQVLADITFLAEAVGSIEKRAIDKFRLLTATDAT